MARIQVLELNPLVERTCAILARVLDARVKVVFEAGTAVPPFLGSAVLVEQTLMRLGLQGADALGPAGGVLRFHTDRHPDGRARLSFELRDWSITPSRPEDHGFVLRRAIVELLDPMGAEIVETRPGGEGDVGILFPPAPEAPMPALHEPAAPPAARGRRLDGLRILVAEDEPEIRFFLREYLGRLGAEVVPAADGEDAWNIWSLLGPFDLLLTDQRMPRMTGMELVAKVRENRPRFPVVVMSGFGLEEFGGAFAADPQLRYLGKPFTVPGLLETLGGLVIPPGPSPDHG